VVSATRNQQTIANSFNDYFLTTAEKLTGANQIDKLSQLKNRAPIRYIFQNCRYYYPNVKFRYTLTGEIEKIIKSLKTKSAMDTRRFQSESLNGVLLLLVPH
jgi:hypothetical protein